jgi:pyridoxal 5'-phosphate synthase pdxS subunit
LMSEAKAIGAPLDIVIEVHTTGKLSVVNFAAGGVATPADAALMMQLGAEGVFVGSGIFKSGNPEKMAKAIVKATTHYKDPSIIAEVSKALGAAMPGRDIKSIPPEELLATRGW